MSNEFYSVNFMEDDETCFFKNKDNAYHYLWQQYLNIYGHLDKNILDEIKSMLNENGVIGDFGYIGVCGFED